jgi:exopolyphosphatase/pppGpp-phosphohydrolase
MGVKRFGPVGIIDIGSNSVRFVAYGGTERVPSVLFNEKLMAAFAEGYRSSFKSADEVLERVREIEYRGRYKTETP